MQGAFGADSHFLVNHKSHLGALASARVQALETKDALIVSLCQGYVLPPQELTLLAGTILISWDDVARG